jgi:single-strand DNA-binding protein
VANISIATTSKRKDKTTGETVEDTQWHRVQFFDRLAEVVGEYVKKGSPIYVEGRLKYGKYTDKDGIERNTVDIIASEMQLLGNRPSGSGGGDQGGSSPEGSGYQRRPAPAPAPRPQASARPPAPAPAGKGFDDMDDDIPF